jgi:hypothetical protein
MEKLVTIATFTLPSELSVAKSLLESEGIRYYTADELTVQSYNFLSNAVGGVKLQVASSDANKAHDLLVAAGIIRPEKDTLTFTEKITGHPNFRKYLKVFFTVFFLIIAAGTGVILYSLFTDNSSTSDFDKLARYDWCLKHIVYKGEVYYPDTQASEEKVAFRMIDECEEEIDFESSGYVVIPGFGTEKTFAHWSVTQNKLKIYDADEAALPLNGLYTLALENQRFTLTSEELRIVGQKTFNKY